MTMGIDDTLNPARPSRITWSSDARAVETDPIYFMVPATLACSVPFLLPISTPPNTIAFGLGYLEQSEMIKVCTVDVATSVPNGQLNPHADNHLCLMA